MGRKCQLGQLADTKIKIWPKKPLGENISNLLAGRDVLNAYASTLLAGKDVLNAYAPTLLVGRDVLNAYAPTVKFFLDEMLINLNMFSSIMLNWVVSNTNSDFIITKEL